MLQPKDIQDISHAFATDLIISDLIVVNGIVYGRRRGGGIPALLLCYLRGIVHGAVFVMFVEIGGNAVGSVGHPDPILADRADGPDVGKLGIVAQPILCHTGAGHSQINKGFVIGVGIGDLVYAVAVAACRAAYADGNNAAKGKGPLGGCGITVVIEGELGL